MSLDLQAVGKIEVAEGKLLAMPQVECPLVHRFAPGVYYREITMPAGSLVIGHCHKTEHFNVITKGKALVMIDGKTEKIEAPYVFVSGAGVRKVLFIIEDMTWATVHPTQETDMLKLEEEIITKSPTWIAHALEEAERLKEIARGETLCLT